MRLQIKEVLPPIPVNLVEPCADFVLADEGPFETLREQITAMLTAHAENMSRAGVCRTRHGKLGDLIESLRDVEGV